MILSSQDIIRMNESPEMPLVENLDPRQIEGGAYDVKIASLEKEDHHDNRIPVLGKSKRLGVPRVRLIVNHIQREDGNILGWRLQPQRWYWIKTQETVHVPRNCRYLILPRLTWNDMAIIFQASAAAPGFSGQLTFSIFPTRRYVDLELGARIAQLEIHLLTADDLSPYVGPRQGGRALNPDGRPERAY
jgi:deoxycytidine triphosphate deaminase